MIERSPNKMLNKWLFLQNKIKNRSKNPYHVLAFFLKNKKKIKKIYIMKLMTLCK